MIKIFLILLVGFSIQGFSQRSKEIVCRKCKKEIQDNYLNKYTVGKRDLIKRNWSEYFGENLIDSMPSKSVPDKVKIYPLKFDALGCFYPEEFNDEEFKRLFSKKKTRLLFFNSNKYVYKKTFYRLKKETLDKYYGSNHLITNFNKITDLQKKTLPDSSMLEFRSKWNNNFGKRHISNIDSIIKKNSIEKIVFVVHGYNLPYSLSHIQFNNIIDLYQEDSNYNYNTLFIPTYWPSTNRKKYNYKNGNFYFKNRLSLKSVSGFPIIINRSFLTGLGLRQILNGIKDFSGEVNMVSHSMGGPTISAALIDPIEKLQTKTYGKNSDLKDNFKNRKLKLMKKAFQTDSLEGNKFKEFKVFLNAPAMPGIETFHLPELGKNNKNVNWTIGFNLTDKVLHKTMGPFRFGDENGNTRLGGNWENETWKTKDYVAKNGFASKFKFVESGIQSDLFGHDFFCYLNQKKFKLAFKDFLKN